MKGNRLKFGLGIGLILASVVWLGFSGFQEGKSYYVTLHELSGMGEQAYNVRLRVAGDVADGSIMQAAGATEFKLIQEESSLNVVYVGNDPLPDTFKGGAQAVVEGIYERNGTFKAEFVQAKCASKYEAGYEAYSTKN